jgi:hypothetical protein
MWVKRLIERYSVEDTVAHVNAHPWVEVSGACGLRD